MIITQLDEYAKNHCYVHFNRGKFMHMSNFLRRQKKKKREKRTHVPSQSGSSLQAQCGLNPYLEKKIYQKNPPKKPFCMQKAKLFWLYIFKTNFLATLTG